MSVKESQTFGKTLSMFEGYGGPVNVNPNNVDYSSGIDPTLEACCEREIVSNRKQVVLESALRRHDRIALAERRRRNVIKDLNFGGEFGESGEGCRCCYDTNDGGEYRALIELRSELEKTKTLEDGDAKEGEDGDDDDDDDGSDDDSEFDYLLDEDLPGDNSNGSGMNNELQLLQQERLEELQLSAMIRESAIQHGFGVHRQFHPQRVLHAAGLGLSGPGSNINNRSSTAAAIPPAAVIHLNEDTLLSASLDICLEEMAMATYRGTKFVRSYGRSTLSFNSELVRRVLPKLKIESSLPALIAVKNGDVVSMCENLNLFVSGSSSNGNNGNDDKKVEPRAVEEWLDRAGVLLHEVPIAYEDYCRIRPEEDALLENMMREKAKLTEAAAAAPKEEDIYNCGIPGCQKVFYHEHIGVKTEEQDGLLLCQEIATGSTSKVAD